MKKRKLFLQIMVCAMITLFATFGGRIDHPVFAKYFAASKALVTTALTREDVSAAWLKVTSTLADAPSKVVSAVTAVNEASKYGVPIDEDGTTRMKQVHAVAGGMVLKSGKNEEYGLYIQIKHEDAVSTYGNLTGVSVVEAERVQRGEIIGSYDSFSDSEFYYELEQNL